ncbi:alpha/beta hydrolase [Actinobacillus porcitonsillarum]|uniref:Alpha/beta hydrolase n=1 Tax=Actinobacillus porcitonsillarum TaxID=189834 RepID=A0A2U8FJI3_9PAST|nr:alpha/beta hydrolase [Actinobacillus porcitonsillarum]AWI51161.1 alpha/beta hydrolase [Actinobacillus porcitonsillarum]
MKKYLVATLLAMASLNVNATGYQSAHLLAPEYKQATLQANEFTQNLSGQLQRLGDNPTALKQAFEQFNAQMLAKAEADPITPSRQLTAPARNKQPAVNLYVFEPTNKKAQSPVIYFMHGGGYLIGNARQQNASLFELANSTGAVVVSVEYRLATVAPYPADIDDAYHGLTYLFDNAEKLGFDKQNIILMGESAGGGLTARLALKTRDVGKYSPKGQVLIYPMLDYRTGTTQSPYRNAYAGEFMWTAEFNRMGWQMLQGGQHISEKELPYYSASMATQFKDLPHTFMAVGSLDLFVNENLDYANRLIQAGVPTDLQVINGVPHSFFEIVPNSAQTQSYKTALNQAISRMLAE